MKIYLSILFFIVTKLSISQCDIIFIKGRVIDTSLNQNFYNMMLINKTSNKGIFGKPDGFFEASINPKDTLIISISGYEKILFYSTDLNKCNYDLEYILKPKTKKLKTIIIEPLKSIQQIKEERQNLSLKENKKMVEGIATIQSPITALYERFSQKAKTEKKINELKYKDSKNKILKDLLSIYVIYEIIELNENEFSQFINFLNIDDTVLKNMNDIELSMMIKDKFEHFKIFKQKK
jgi:hypothetical protein